MSIDMAQFHQVFFEESFEGLDIMESGLLGMNPGEVDSEQINAIFRAAHSIKGGSGTFGFSNIASFTHVMETLLDEMRDGRRPVTREGVEVLLRSVDVLRDMMRSARDGDPLDERRVAEQKSDLERVLQGERAAVAPACAPAPKTAEVTPAAALQPRRLGWHIVFRPLPHMMRTGNDPLRIIQELAELGELRAEGDASAIPRMSEFEPEDCYLSWNLWLTTDAGRDQLDEIFAWIEDDCDLAVIEMLEEGADQLAPRSAITQSQAHESHENQIPSDIAKSNPGAAASKKSHPQSSAPPPPSPGGGGSSIRVDITKIDALINMVGELVITQSMLGMLGQHFDMARLERLQDGLTQLERHTRELQESVMQIRMLPISFTFSRFPRLVHDLSSKLGKKIELKMSGENTEVDKTVIEKIGDPLVHLVRNSLDHGIEMPHERVAAGKPETGTVFLNAYHRGGNIVIEVRDDGGGLNRDKLISKAVERGLLTEDAKLSEKDAYELIFRPGFSTADEVSDISGRGVGMDVVRKNISELGGSIEIDAEPGQGTSIIIRLPLTLAILDGQTVAVGEENYIVPLVSIIESIQVKRQMVNLIAGKGETFKLRDEYLPVVRLHEIFGVENPKTTDLTEGLLVVVEGEGRRCGLFVDDLLGQQQVVIKSLEANYGRVEGISGATILGDGSVGLILDIPGLMRLSKREEFSRWRKSA